MSSADSASAQINSHYPWPKSILSVNLVIHFITQDGGIHTSQSEFVLSARFVYMYRGVCIITENMMKLGKQRRRGERSIKSIGVICRNAIDRHGASCSTT